jgi:protein SCO1
MKKYLKTGLLTLTLVGPVLVVILLHTFAENHYILLHFFPATDPMGKVQMSGQDTIYSEVAFALPNQITVLNTAESDSASAIKIKQELQRISREIPNVGTMPDKQSETADFLVEKIAKIKLSKTFKPNGKLVLVDKSRNVRGIYDGTNPEEIERLRAEVKVLIDIYKKSN